MISPAEYIEELKRRISYAIRICVPPSDEAVRASMDIVFAGYLECFVKMLENKVIPERLLDFGPLASMLEASVIQELTANAEFDTPKYIKYLANIFSAIHTDAIEDSSIPEEIKAMIASGSIKIMADNKTLFLANSADDRIKDIEKKYQEIVREFTAKGLEITPLKQYIEGTTSQTKLKELPLLFDKKLIEKLDNVLRGKWFSESSPKLVSVFIEKGWINNTPSVEWGKSRDSLLNLIRLFNNNESKLINGGVIGDLVAKTFIIQGKIVRKELMINSYSRFLQKPHAKLSEDVWAIEKIFNECKSKD